MLKNTIKIDLDEFKKKKNSIKIDINKLRQ